MNARAKAIRPQFPAPEATRLPRRNFLRLIGGSAALQSLSRDADADTWPARPVRFIVGFPPGGASDIAARVVGQSLAGRLGQPFVIENRPGAGSNIAAEYVVRSPRDGYTILLVNAANAINATLYERLSFDFLHDITPIAGLIQAPIVMVVNPSLPAKSVPEFIAFSKAHSGKVNMASAGTGTSPHVTGEMFKMMTGLELSHVPYRGGAPALTDLMAGNVQVFFATLPSSIEYIKAGKLRALAVTTAARSPALPQVPALGEFVPGYEATDWYGVGGPKGLSGEIVRRLNAEINAVLLDPVTQARFSEMGAAVLVKSPSEFEKLIAAECEKWAAVVKFSGAKID